MDNRPLVCSSLFWILMVSASLSPARAEGPQPPAIIKKIPPDSIFNNPGKLQLYYFPAYNFGFPSCNPRDQRGEMRFSVDKTPGSGSYVLSYTWTPSPYSGKGVPPLFQEAIVIALDVTKGDLTVQSYATSITVRLASYLPSDNLQASYKSFGGTPKKVLPNSPYINNIIDQQLGAPFMDGNKVAKEALFLLARTATRFSRANVPWPCLGFSTVPGSSKLAPFVKYLNTLARMPDTILPGP